jgi:predicted dienelactone hydrolase
MRLRQQTRAFASILVVAGFVLLMVSLLVTIFRTRAQNAVKKNHPVRLAYKLASGPFAIDVLDRVLHDAKRNKDLEIRIVTPRSGSHFPVIVFSHGAGGSGQNYAPLTWFWASHGYVVIQPTHDDSIALRREKGEPLPSGPRELIEEYRFNYEDWIDRVADVRLVIDSLPELPKELRDKIDRNRIGVGGHSYGAFTTQMIGGVRLNIPGQKPAQSFADERPRALLLLSPQGKSENGLTESSWAEVSRPMMSMTGSKDGLGLLPRWREDPFNYSPPPDKYLVFIEGAFHMSFTGALAEPQGAQGPRRQLISQLTAGTDQKAVFDYVKIASIAFWDAYLKHDATAKAYLKSNSLIDYSGQDVTLNRK